MEAEMKEAQRTGTRQTMISVLLPAYDAAATLPLCLRSLQRQTETRWECILVDDGSHDETGAIARAFADRDPRFRVLTCAHHGLIEALCTGLTECNAGFIARMDADDWMHRERLALQLDALHDDPKLAGVGCHVRIFPRRDATPGRRAYERWLNAISTPDQVAAEAFVECPIAHPTLCMRADVLRAFSWRDRGWPEDYDLVLRLLAAGEQLAVVPRRLLGWRDGKTRLSRTDPAYGLGRFTACKAAFLARTFLARSTGYILWGYGDTGRSLRKALLAHDHRPTHIVELHPGRIGQRIHGAPVVRPEALTGLRDMPIVVSVAGTQPRGQIRRALSAMGFRETLDYVCAA